MLILTRRVGEAFTIQTTDGPIRVLLSTIGNGRVRLGVEAPESCHILRDELLPDPQPAEAEKGERP